MGTKTDPGKYDCYASALPDEPVFVLLGRDPAAPILVREWADLREQAVIAGERPDVADIETVFQARQVAYDMVAWRKSNDGRWRRPVRKFDDRFARTEPREPAVVGPVAAAIRQAYRVEVGGDIPEATARRIARAAVDCVRDRLNACFNTHLVEMKPGYDDSITGFNEAWDVVRRELGRG